MMSAPRLQIDLRKITHNAQTLVERLDGRGIGVTGVTKATLGAPEIACALLSAGVADLADSRIENIEAMRHAKVPAQMSLIRSPMLSQAKRVVMSADTSFNTEIATIRRLSSEAYTWGRTHGVVLMVELGDLREGIMPNDLLATVGEVLELPNIIFSGIGTNLACRSGACPDDDNMKVLSGLVESVEATFGVTVDIVSGGNSANLHWALNGKDSGRINNLRLGESILLGCETLNRRSIEGLHQDAITLVAEVIESKRKPTKPIGRLAQAAFGKAPIAIDRGNITQTILAIGMQDIDPTGLKPPHGTTIIGCSSDHLLISAPGKCFPVGSEMAFQLGYDALLRAMTSPFVTKSITSANNLLHSSEAIVDSSAAGVGIDKKVRRQLT
ncbi:MAG: alanine/ornithine racemase family PLP-dependent enzyme [Gammaproteobacteria bacterium]